MRGPVTRRPRSGVVLRAAVSVALVTILLVWLSTTRILEQLGQISAATWAGVILLFLTGHAVSAMKWRMLIGSAGAPVSRFVALRAHAAGLCANLCLPSIVGGDVVRAGLAVRTTGHLEAVALGSLADRLVDTTALVGIAAAGAMFVAGPARASAITVLTGVGVVLAIAVVAAFVVVRAAPIGRAPARLQRVVEKARDALAALFAAPGAAAVALGLSLAIQGGFVGLNLVLARAIGIELPTTTWMFAWPLAKLVALVPVSLGGIGVREVALVAFMAPFGVGATQAVAQSVAWETVLIVAGLLSGAFTLGLGGSLSFGAPRLQENR